jgi:hypothetical protein
MSPSALFQIILNSNIVSSYAAPNRNDIYFYYHSRGSLSIRIEGSKNNLYYEIKIKDNLNN